MPAADAGAGPYDHERPTPEELGLAICEPTEDDPAEPLPSPQTHPTRA